MRYRDEVKGKRAVGFIENGHVRDISFIPEIAAKECWDCQECFAICPTSYAQAAYFLTEALAFPGRRKNIAQATHGATVLTCYDPWSQGGDFARNRSILAQADWATLAARFLGDLRLAHPDIDRIAARLDIRIWGHAMASPGRGFFSHPARALTGLGGKLLFAHTDAAGYSVFEEASWLGMRAAQKALAGA